MIEAILTWDLLPNVDQQGYGAFAQKAIGATMKAPGLIEFRANRNMLGSPQVRSTSVFKTLADWANFNDSVEWRDRVEIWGPSPVLPEPVRPG
jgi:heme-degrading monooxygenase HmoA